jgi:hypothetical protein
VFCVPWDTFLHDDSDRIEDRSDAKQCGPTENNPDPHPPSAGLPTVSLRMKTQNSIAVLG